MRLIKRNHLQMIPEALQIQMIPPALQISILVLALANFAIKKMLKLLYVKLSILWEHDPSIYVPTV